jgi:hypothetical protein
MEWSAIRLGGRPIFSQSSTRLHMNTRKTCYRMFKSLILMLAFTPAIAVDPARPDDGVKECGWGTSLALQGDKTPSQCAQHNHENKHLVHDVIDRLAFLLRDGDAVEIRPARYLHFSADESGRVVALFNLEGWGGGNHHTQHLTLLAPVTHFSTTRML